jgi:hypothetical protein
VDVPSRPSVHLVRAFEFFRTPSKNWVSAAYDRPITAKPFILTPVRN